jgi:ubiquinone/menaquinone biosynthesis C-methylase UbiE
VAAAYRPHYAQAAVRWALEFSPGLRVLDLGAGTGKLTAMLVAPDADVVAVSSTQVALERACQDDGDAPGQPRGPNLAPNEKQNEAWNGGESVHYVDHADRYDRQLAPFTEALLQRIRLTPHGSVLDVGCGCGALTLAVARTADSAVGIDISVPLTQVASERAGSAQIDNVEFVIADAQTYAFAPGTFDLVISQFGLMFFDDPVGAFSNLRRSLTPGGRLAFISWQGLPANEWLSVIATEVAKHVAVPQFGGLSNGPGMFALKDQGETTALLESAGFTEVTFESLAPTILLGGGGTLDQSMDFLLGMGMARGLVGLAGASATREVVEEVRLSFAERYKSGVGVELGAAAWMVTALD